MSISASHQEVHSVYQFNSRCQELTDSFTIQFIIHIHSVFQISHFNSIFTFVFSFQRYSQSMCSFHIRMHVLFLYTHSCIHFIYSFMHSHSYLVIYQNTLNKNRVREQTEAVGSSFLLFDLGPGLGDHHPSLVNNNHATLSG